MRKGVPLVALALVGAAGCAAPTEDLAELEQEVVRAGASYTITGVQSDKCIEVASSAAGADLVTGTCNGKANQEWRFESMGAGYFRLRNVGTNQCMDVEGWSTRQGARVMQWECTSGANQQFRAHDLGDGVHELVNRHSGLSLDVSSARTTAGTPLIQWPSTGRENQLFRLTPAGDANDSYPCDGSTSGYDAVVTKTGASWETRHAGRAVYSGTDMRAAIQAGIDRLSRGRTTKQKVLVQGSGSISTDARINLASHTVLNVCGTIHVTGSGSRGVAPIYARGKTNIEIPHVKITGSPAYGMFFRDVDNLHLGQIDLRVSTGLGIRIDNHGRADRSQKVKNIRLDHVHVEGTGSHGVETYGVDGITIGTVVARNTHDCGLLLNDTVNANIGTIDAQGAGTGTGYAAFRMANRNGRIDGRYPTNIRVGSVIARGGGRGIFCVSESGGATIDRVDIAQTGNNAMLIENCYNVTIAATSGSVTGSEIRIASRSTFPVSSNITVQNLALKDASIRESPCASGTVVRNNTLSNSRLSLCNGSDAGGNVSR